MPEMSYERESLRNWLDREYCAKRIALSEYVPACRVLATMSEYRCRVLEDMDANCGDQKLEISDFAG